MPIAFITTIVVGVVAGVNSKEAISSEVENKMYEANNKTTT